MEWKNNRLVGMGGITIALICIIYLINLFIISPLKARKEAQKNYEKWKERHIFNKDGRIIGSKEVVENEN